MNGVLFPSASCQKDEELRESIKQNGQLTPVLLAGEGCWSEPGTLLSGHRRLLALSFLGQDKIIGVRVDDLNQGQEIALMIACNQADLTTRDVTEEDQYKIEEAVRSAICRGPGRSEQQGQESTVKGRQGQRGDTQGRTDELVGKQLGVTLNAVRQRKKIFGSLMVTRVLLDALNRGQLERSNTFSLVSEIEKKFKDKDLSDPSARDALSREVNKRVETAILFRHTRGRRKQAEDVLAGASKPTKPSQTKKPSKVQGTPVVVDSASNELAEVETGTRLGDDASGETRHPKNIEPLIVEQTSSLPHHDTSDQTDRKGPCETIVLQILNLTKQLENSLKSSEVTISKEAEEKLDRVVRKLLESAEEMRAALEEDQCQAALRQPADTNEAA